MKNFSKILVTSAVAGSVIFGNLPMVFANPQQTEIEAKICENIEELRWFKIVNNDVYWIYEGRNPDKYSFYEYIDNYFKNLSKISYYDFHKTYTKTDTNEIEISENTIIIDGAEFTTRPLKNDETITFLKKIGNDFYYTINLFDNPTRITTLEIYKNHEKLWEIKSASSTLRWKIGWEVIVNNSGIIYATSLEGDKMSDSYSVYKISNGKTEKIKEVTSTVDMADMSEGFYGNNVSIYTLNNDFYISSFYTAGDHDKDFYIEKNGKPLCEKVATPHPLEEKIAKLPTLNTVTLADEAKITEMKKEFDALSAEDKKKISAENQKKLNDLIEKIAELKKKKEEDEKKNNSGNSGNSGNNSNNSNNSSSSSSGGSGGGGAVYNTPNTPSNLNLTTKIEPTKIKAPKTENSTKLFPKFVAKKEQTVKDLRDTKLADLNKRFGITNEKTRNEALSRGEFLKIVLDSANVNVSSISTEKLAFSDVGKNTEIAKYIAFARENNIISGYSDNTFRADATISRAEATKILMESLNVKIAEKNTTFADVNKENTLGKYIQTAYDNFILNGTSKTIFEPNRSISRGELIKIIYNILN